MRFLIYNIAYGTGSPSGRPEQILTLGRYLHTGLNHLEKIRECITMTDPDVTGLVEVDKGSFRTGFHDQTYHIAEGLDLQAYGAVKYAPHTLYPQIPILRKQANSFLVKNGEEAHFLPHQYFPVGMKRLILQLRYRQVTFILLHLALDRTTRRRQLAFLRRSLRSLDTPFIIGGDLNTFQGEEELVSFCRALKLRSANKEKIPTYPSWAPRFQLDHILCSEEISIRDFQVLDLQGSDHLPLLLDFELGSDRQ